MLNSNIRVHKAHHQDGDKFKLFDKAVMGTKHIGCVKLTRECLLQLILHQILEAMIYPF